MEPSIDVLTERVENCQKRAADHNVIVDGRIMRVERKCEEMTELLRQMREEWLVGRAQLTAGSKLFIALMTGVVAPVLSAVMIYLLRQ